MALFKVVQLLALNGRINLMNDHYCNFDTTRIVHFGVANSHGMLPLVIYKKSQLKRTIP